MKDKYLRGIQGMSKKDLTAWLIHHYGEEKHLPLLESYQHPQEHIQRIHDSFSEHTLSNFHLPLGIAPNFWVDGVLYCVPMVTEESSVVAAAYQAATFWKKRGGFSTLDINTEKIGHIHFTHTGNTESLQKFFKTFEYALWQAVSPLSEGMKARGGGIKKINLIDKTKRLSHYHQIEVLFDTCDAMGANFINSCLEAIARRFKELFNIHHKGGTIEIIMAILSNYNPNSFVKVSATCHVDEFLLAPGTTPQQNINKFKTALDISKSEVHRAVTHNKGIFNGIDAVLTATGNDYRAVEASGHAYASKSGAYQPLTHMSLEEEFVKFWIEIPLSLGVVGGLTGLHPLSKFALEIMGNPTAKQLMSIVAAVGLAQNFAAVRALITKGIQRGHMKLHLPNLLKRENANPEEIKAANLFFQGKTPSSKDIKEFLKNYKSKD